jgi:hypothetical protein
MMISVAAVAQSGSAILYVVIWTLSVLESRVLLGRKVAVVPSLTVMVVVMMMKNHDQDHDDDDPALFIVNRPCARRRACSR